MEKHKITALGTKKKKKIKPKTKPEKRPHKNQEPVNQLFCSETQLSFNFTSVSLMHR